MLPTVGGILPTVYGILSAVCGIHVDSPRHVCTCIDRLGADRCNRLHRAMLQCGINRLMRSRGCLAGYRATCAAFAPCSRSVPGFPLAGAGCAAVGGGPKVAATGENSKKQPEVVQPRVVTRHPRTTGRAFGAAWEAQRAAVGLVAHRSLCASLCANWIMRGI